MGANRTFIGKAYDAFNTLVYEGQSSGVTTWQ